MSCVTSGRSIHGMQGSDKVYREVNIIVFPQSLLIWWWLSEDIFTKLMSA